MSWRHLFVVQIELSVDGIYLSEETFNGYVDDEMYDVLQGRPGAGHLGLESQMHAIGIWSGITVLEWIDADFLAQSKQDCYIQPACCQRRLLGESFPCNFTSNS